MASQRSEEDWKAIIEPHLSVSLRDASDAITRTDQVQEWLQSASLDAASGMGDVSGVQGQMHGYMRMMRALDDRLPELLDAVSELTEGCGTVDLHWRPTNPNYSRLYIDFGRSYTVKVFTRLANATKTETQNAITTISDALPKGAPFPNRPNTVTGMVAFSGQCVGVRVSERLAEGGESTYQSVALLPKNRNDVEQLSPDTAAKRLVQLLTSEESAASSE